MNTPAEREAQAEPEREVRFAVVIYGGVSLAIYINGIVQELLRMVRSTALPWNKLTELEKVYRRLGHSVGVGVTNDPDEKDRMIEIYADPGSSADPGWPPRTRFVADIFSGTSAGGINAIFAAKALARGETLDELLKLWINVADIDKLLNDRGSIEKPLRLDRPPASLLNAKWMYLQLLNALTGMDNSRAANAEPVVGDLDVYLTATDLDGLPLPLALAHQSVRENRHRNVFHFVRREGDRDDFAQKNDFSDSNNPFFAFAARCTSAFPFAFEPMALCDIFPIISQKTPYQGHAYCNVSADCWQKFYLDYIGDIQAGGTPFQFRAFGDGGYLDNKPFSYAIDTVIERAADLPVDRKLIYIEPSPETIVEPNRQGPNDRPDAAQNSLDALLVLPRYETIREDLMRVLDWNSNIARLKRIIRDLNIPDGVDSNSPAFRAYLRLRHSVTLDSMTLRILKALDIDPTCSLAAALRELIDGYMPPNSSEVADVLRSYDFDYYVRAAQYLRRRLKTSGPSEREDQRALAGLKRRIRKCKEDPLTSVLVKLTSDQLEDLKALDAQHAAIHNREPRRERRRQLASGWLDKGWRDGLKDADSKLRQHFAKLFQPEEIVSLLDKHGGFARFVAQDSIIFPIIFGTKLGEFGEIDVIRISPQDVTEITGVTEPPYRSIRGQKYGAFGAFLDKRWRKHDLLRGRLDGAECLITAILPGNEPQVSEARRELIRDAQAAIAREWEEKGYAAL